MKRPVSTEYTNVMPRRPHGQPYKLMLRDPYWEGRERASSPGSRRVNFGFSEEQGEFREMLVRFFEEKSPITEVFRLQQTAEGNDPAVWKQMAEELGLQGIHLPVESGGQGFGFLELGIVMEEMGRNLVCSPYFSTVCLAANAILNAGTLEQKQRWLPGIASGGIIATLALLETGDIWSADGVRLSFETDGNSYRLSGTKRLVTDAASADLLVVAARQPCTTGEDGLPSFRGRWDAAGPDEWGSGGGGEPRTSARRGQRRRERGVQETHGRGHARQRAGVIDGVVRDRNVVGERGQRLPRSTGHDNRIDDVAHDANHALQQVLIAEPQPCLVAADSPTASAAKNDPADCWIDRRHREPSVTLLASRLLLFLR